MSKDERLLTALVEVLRDSMEGQPLPNYHGIEDAATTVVGAAVLARHSKNPGEDLLRAARSAMAGVLMLRTKLWCWHEKDLGERVIAESAEEADTLYLEYASSQNEDVDPAVLRTWVAQNMDEFFTFCDYNEDTEKEATFAVWCILRGKGHFASESYR